MNPPNPNARLRFLEIACVCLGLTGLFLLKFFL